MNKSGEKITIMSKNDDSYGCIDGVCSVLPKVNCVELCEYKTEKNNIKNDFIHQKSVMTNSNIKNLTIKGLKKFDGGVEDVRL